ncbi:threonine aldolase family protein [Pedobacter cryophilus]|uniref:Aminotransferase class III-fold pyridoxal phosphate-dependent enzyme n=1 Tax=Pedobacter cryophilus TaxID=2571271 RepID=A0A4U1BXH8_9SPHI|nr:GntG family PLP-dependent aldolase [Pedobacter cryophilus]TKB97051.1 aminotransferase class III-fold pyridoxal phosphate-dependent enzyme [Pedobacter cryophilus]
MIDFRSDTVTKPTEHMLAAMFTAKVGDDVFGEDETVNALEEKSAELFGMEAALFCPSGTMTNQIAIKCFTQPLDEVITDQTAHVYRYEGGGIMFNSAASVRLLNGDRGRITAEMIEDEINPVGNVHHPHSSLVVLENTVNRGGGSCYTLEDIEPIYHLCKLKGMKLHLDGARIFNALAATGDKPKDYGKYFDGISVCLSKGLGAPVGSVLLGSKETIQYARRVRKVLGGGMRQAGFLAAAGIYALDHHVERLSKDHLNASLLADTLIDLPFVKSIMPVDTNIIIFELNDKKDASHLVEELKDKGILCGTFGKQMIRFVTHLDITESKVSQAIEILKKHH